jgi:hypothetical protein
LISIAIQTVVKRVGEKTYSTGGDLVVAGLASDLEGNAIGGSVLELEGGGGQVVEILVEELNRQQESQRSVQKLRQWAFSTALTKSGGRDTARPTARVSELKMRAGREAYIVGRLGDISESRDRHDGGCV